MSCPLSLAVGQYPAQNLRETAFAADVDLPVDDGFEGVNLGFGQCAIP